MKTRSFPEGGFSAFYGEMMDRLLAGLLGVIIVGLPWVSFYGVAYFPVAAGGLGALYWIRAWIGICQRGSVSSMIAGGCWVAFLLVQAAALLHVGGIDPGDRTPGSATIVEALVPYLPGTVSPDLQRAAIGVFALALGACAWLVDAPVGSAERRWMAGCFFVAALVAVTAGVLGKEGYLLPGFGGHHAVFQPFEYRNHSVLFSLLGLSCSLAVALSIGRMLGGCVIVIAMAAAFCLPLSGSRLAVVTQVAFVTLLGAGIVLRRDVFRRVYAGRSRVLILALAGIGLLVVGGVSSWALASTGRMKDTTAQLEALSQGEFPDLRIPAAMAAWKAAEDRPLWGWGAGSFPEYLPIYAGDSFYARRHQPETKNFGKLIPTPAAHNDLVEWLSEFGAIGLSLLLAPLFIHRFRSRGGTRSGSAESGFMRVGIAVFLGAALYDYPLHHPAVLIAFFVLWGVERSFAGAHPSHRASSSP